MNQIKVGAALNYVIIGLNTVVGLAYTPYMLRCLGQNEYGLYSLVASVIAYLTILDFGFGNAIIRYTAKFRAEGKTQKQWEMFGMFLIVYSIIGLIAFCGGLALYFNVDAMFDQTMSADDLNQARVMMSFLIVNLALTFPLSIFGSIITAYEDFVFQKTVQIIRILLCTSTLVCLLYMGYKAIAMIVVQTIFNITTLLLNFLYCRYHLKINICFNNFDWIFLKEIGIYSFWIFLNSIMDRIYWGTGQFVLGAVSGTIAVAVFSIAITFQTMYIQFSTSIASVLLPRITAMVTVNHSDKEISDIFIKTGRLQAIVMCWIIAGFIVFGKGFINLWAGSDYGISYWITLIFFSSLFIPLIQNVGITILQARNQMKFRSICYIMIASISLVLQIYLSKLFGELGCAIAIGSALIVGQGIVMNIYYKKFQNIDINRFWREIIKMSIVPFSLMILGVICQIYFQFSNVLELGLGMIVFSLTYFYLMYRFSLNSYEKSIINKSWNILSRMVKI